MHNPGGVKLGYIWLQPGVTRLNGWTLLYVLFISIGLLVFLNFQQPYVLEVMLGIPQAEHGRHRAEAEDHHPLIVTEWGNVTVQWWTYAIRGLHKNDFIMAAKIDSLPFYI